MPELMELQVIQEKIYTIRGQRVMLDFDLAGLYQVETRRLKEAVRRNLKRFPGDFMFEMTKSEWKELVANCDKLPETVKHTPKPPFAFTEHGVTMLAGLLRSDMAIQMNVQIVRAFVAMRNYLLNGTHSTAELDDLRRRMKLLEENTEDTAQAMNDMSEDFRKELDDIYFALGQLAEKNKQREQQQVRRMAGFRRPDDDK